MPRRNQRKALFWLTFLWLVWLGWYVTGSRESVVEVVDDRGTPVAGAEIRDGDRVVATTDDSGRTGLTWRGSRVEFDVKAPGFRPAWFRPVEGDTWVDLEPYVLTGRVLDPEGAPVAGATVRSGDAVATTDRSGGFDVRGGEPGRAIAWMPAWTEGSLEWDGSSGRLDIVIEPMVVRAFHVGPEISADPRRWEDTLRLIDATGLNGVMLDLKGEQGWVWYDSQVSPAREVGAVAVRYDLAGIARQLDERDVYLIGRLVTFQDPILAHARPEMAVGWDGGVFGRDGQAFLDPTDSQARRYGLDLAVEACRLGVDEIQFDYVRYPDDFPVGTTFDGPFDQEGRVKTIASFLAEARTLLRPLGCAVAADVFGFTTTATDDGGIGQHWETVAAELDVISPMLYPSHYDNGWYSFDRPVDHPGEVVLAALADGLPRLHTPTVVRPWLQDFGYDEGQVREQIAAAESYGLGWMLWNAVSDVTEEALD